MHCKILFYIFVHTTFFSATQSSQPMRTIILVFVWMSSTAFWWSHMQMMVQDLKVAWDHKQQVCVCVCVCVVFCLRGVKINQHQILLPSFCSVCAKHQYFQMNVSAVSWSWPHETQPFCNLHLILWELAGTVSFGAQIAVSVRDGLTDRLNLQ